MARAVFADESPLPTDQLAAAAVLCRTEHGNLHMGIMYRGRGQKPEFLHLAWDDALSRDWESDWRYLWASPEVEPERLRAMGGLCRQVWRRYQEDRRFAYALGFGGTTFDVSGRVVLGPNARGLTCATFVLALFKYFGIELVDEPSWPVRTKDDRKFLRQVAPFTKPEHLAILESEVDAGCRRIRPEEVLGACAIVELPATFEATRCHAEEILSRI
jgi:hypothetical protein